MQIFQRIASLVAVSMSPILTDTVHAFKDINHDHNVIKSTINVGVNPAGIAITHDSKFAYVANSNDYEIMDCHTISVIDLGSHSILKTIRDSSFNQPYRIAINKKTNLAYVTNSGGTTVTIIDTLNNSISGIIDGFDGPSSIVIAPHSSKAYVGNWGAGSPGGQGKTVSVVDLKTDSIIKVIAVPAGPVSLAMSEDEQFVYLISYGAGNPNPADGSVSIIRSSDDVVIKTINRLSGPYEIAISRDIAYITNFGTNNFAPFGRTVSVLNLTSKKMSKSIEVGIQPSGVAITPNKDFLYVSNYNTLYARPNFSRLSSGEGTISVIDVRTHEVVLTIPVGASPESVAISPDGKYALVTHFEGNTVKIISLDPRMTTQEGCSTVIHDEN
ncbi:MAG: YncE family protein [Myxococcaceae bacterium]|nr:YncE family protein [Myxococcaceae bacterium]MBH2006816.1 YncE family protein [Myxococcaceae bacterium]